MINIVIESGGCRSDIFEGKGEVARVALMWLFPSSPPPPAAASDQATEWSVRWPSLPPLARLFSDQPRPFARCCARVEGVQMKEKGFILWEACTAEDHRRQSERMLRVPMPLYPSSLFSIYYQVTSMQTGKLSKSAESSCLLFAHGWGRNHTQSAEVISSPPT